MEIHDSFPIPIDRGQQNHQHREHADHVGVKKRGETQNVSCAAPRFFISHFPAWITVCMFPAGADSAGNIREGPSTIGRRSNVRLYTILGTLHSMIGQYIAVYIGPGQSNTGEQSMIEESIIGDAGHDKGGSR